MTIKQFILPPLKIYLKIVAIILVVNVIFEILFIFFNPTVASAIFIWNPLVNSFIHSGLEHLFYNLIALFLLLLPKINHTLGLKNILGITTLIACMCFPFELLQISLPIVGISGMFYFLLTRFVLSLNKFKIAFRIVFGIMIIGEISVMGNNDSTSHFCHMIGVLIGFLEHYNFIIKPTSLFQTNKKEEKITI